MANDPARALETATRAHVDMTEEVKQRAAELAARREAERDRESDDGRSTGR